MLWDLVYYLFYIPYLLLFNPVTGFLYALVGFFGLFTVAVPALAGFLLSLLGPQDLKKKYGAEWAVVTGGSSGIGKAMVDRLCGQGINVIILAVPEPLLEEAAIEMRTKYPGVQVEAVGADLSKPGFMEALDEHTSKKGRNVQLLFCNAGFMLTGFFHSTPFGKTKANSEVNVGCHLQLTHEYVSRMMRFDKTVNGKRGAVFFTSSPAWMLPGPTAAMYAGTKAFVSNFGAALAAELRTNGVDVCVIHPSPIQSRFYENAGSGAEVNFFKSTATTPEVLASYAFSSVGRLVFANQGYFPKVMGVMHKFLDFTCLVEITANVAHNSGTFKLVAEMDAAKVKAAKSE